MSDIEDISLRAASAAIWRHNQTESDWHNTANMCFGAHLVSNGEARASWDLLKAIAMTMPDCVALV